LTFVLTRILASLAILALAWGWTAGPARADGDPASDVLVTQPLFLPADAGIPGSEQTRLQALVEQAGRSGYPIRVALIASATDLGSVTALWRQPQSYAEYLGAELSLVYRGPLLVVMPNGFGLYRVNLSTAAAQSALGGIRAPRTTAGLGAVSETAVRRLATASGHPLTALPATLPSAPAAASGSSAAPVIALALGALAIVLAWAASLRARPLRHPPPRQPSSIA
jgi:hypothetical protein